MPWDRPESWDTALADGYRALIALRRSSAALQSGGLRLAHVDDDAIAYLRESPQERVLVVASRAGHAPLRIPLALLGARALDTLYGAEALIEGGDAVLPAEGPCLHAWRLIA
jgi:alpha-glucosidase